MRRRRGWHRLFRICCQLWTWWRRRGGRTIIVHDVTAGTLMGGILDVCVLITLIVSLRHIAFDIPALVSINNVTWAYRS